MNDSHVVRPSFWGTLTVSAYSWSLVFLYWIGWISAYKSLYAGASVFICGLKNAIVVDQEPLSVGCSGCLSTPELQFDFTMAFQPIVNLGNGTIFAQEALVRGPNNESAASILGQVTDESRYRFDQACRVRAIQLAAELGIQSMVSINFLPNAVYQPDLCIRTTIETAKQFNFPLNKILFELTEVEKVQDYAHVRAIIEHYQKLGFKTALDDFGAGYSGLNFLADFQPDFIKLDMALIRNIDQDKGRQAIVRGIIQVCRELAIEPIAEGVETDAELNVLKQMDIQLFQGYYFARPSFRSITTNLNRSP